MAENLLNAGIPGTDDPSPVQTVMPAASGKRPPQLPDKFWDEKTGQVRLDALTKSYLDLERKLGSMHREIPERPEDYQIAVKDDLLTIDHGINCRLHEAGFTRDQAQLVYDLACDHMMPMIGELATAFEADNQMQRLEHHFGGKDRWREIARQIDLWGRAHLPKRVFEALATTLEGVLTMHRMMTDGEEPGLVRDGVRANGLPSDSELRTMMRDPRYWRDQDPTYVAQVREGFRRLYQDRG